MSTRINVKLFPQCSTALEYYNRFCGAMFRGSRCTKRCLNSIRILQRQKGGDKLEECRCTGDERYDCKAIKVSTKFI